VIEKFIFFDFEIRADFAEPIGGASAIRQGPERFAARI
jgi:hypothetical protein